MIRLTASGLDRISVCAGSVALPQFPHVGSDTEWGSVVARFRDDVQKHGREYALAQIEDADVAARCSVIDTTDVPPGAESEVAIAYDPESDTAERLQLDAHRAYPDDGRIYGTADRVGIYAPGTKVRAWLDGVEIEIAIVVPTLYLEDDKSGTMKVSAQQAMQLRFLALAFCRLYGLDEARGSMSYLRHDGQWWRDRFSFDALDLDAIREELLDIRADARRAVAIVERGGLPQLLPGLHCTHCAAAVECPAQERQRAELARIEPATLTEYLAALSPERRGALVETAAIVAKKAEQVREAARAYVEAHGAIALPSGRRLAFVPTSVQVMSATAKEEMAALRDSLRARCEITTGSTTQLRIVGSARKDG